MYRPKARLAVSDFGPAVERIQRYPLATLRTGHSITYDVAANWKLILENYNECYHCGGLHPELCEIVPSFKQAGGSNLHLGKKGFRTAKARTPYENGRLNRAPFSGLSKEETVRHKGELCFPNLMISLACDHVAAFLLAIAPNCTRIV